MRKQKIVILGANGMLGSAVASFFNKQPEFEVIPVTREMWDLNRTPTSGISALFYEADWVINCAGIIKPRIANNEEEAIRVNALFPHALAKFEIPTIQIATDCVYDGKEGYYDENSLFSPEDTYGMTKLLGEAQGECMYHLRCSIIGPKKGNPSLLEWFLSQQGEVKGFVNHFWNGVTTLAFAKVCAGIIKENMVLPHVQHLVPENWLDKYHLLNQIKEVYEKDDVTLYPSSAPQKVNRVLTTNKTGINKSLWKAAGYHSVPTIEQMLTDLRQAQITGELNV